MGVSESPGAQPSQSQSSGQSGPGAPSGTRRRKPVIGLAGGIGAGKSSVARVLESLGAAVIDSDRLGHEALREPAVVETVCRWWGDGICHADGSIDRRAIGEIVFQEPQQLRRLERLLYPRIGRRRADLIDFYEACPEVQAIVIDAPKLYEAGVDKVCDAVIFVDTVQRLRVQRVAVARGWTEAELLRRQNLQNPLDIKKANADYILENNSSIDRLRVEVEEVLSSVLASFSSLHPGCAPDL